MPVRIYDISKKLGLENKEVLAKAKELGIAAARVASSSLDKITAEYLEDKLKEAHPEITAPPPPPPALPAAAPVAEPITVVRAEPSPAPALEVGEAAAAGTTVVLEPEARPAETGLLQTQPEAPA